MIGFLKRIFKPNEIKATLLALKLEEEKCQDYLSFKFIKTDVLRLINDYEKTVCSIKEEKMPPNVLVNLLMTNAIQSYLTSGRYHVCRGMLSMVGKDLLRLWDYSVGQLHDSSYHTEEEVKIDRNWIREQIKDIG